MGFRADVRSAAVAFLEAYSTAQSVKLQVYPGRPRSINPPCAFVDAIRETRVYTGPTLVQRSPIATVIVLHGTWDSAEAVAQGDAFVDGFLAYVDQTYGQAGPGTTIGAVSTEDTPNYVPDWLPPELQRVYYATTIELEGFATGT